MEPNKYVQKIALAPEIEKKVGLAEIKVGEITIRGIQVWRSTSGRLRVFFPSYHVAGSIWEDSVDVPPEQRSDIEAEIIAAYRDQKRELADKVAARTKQ